MSHLARVAAVVLTVVMIGAGCAHSQSPVLYPNAKLKEAAKAQADAEILARIDRPLTLPSPPSGARGPKKSLSPVAGERAGWYRPG